MGILSLGNPKAQSEPLDDSFFTPERLAEIFPHISLEDISEASKAGLRDLIMNDNPEGIREYVRTKIKNIGQSIKEDLHNKITTDTDFHSLREIKKYTLDELRRNWIFPTGIEVQIAPFHKTDTGEYAYLEISVTSGHGDDIETGEIVLTTSDTDVTSVTLWNIIYAFEQDIARFALTVFEQEMERRDGFGKVRIQQKIDAVVSPEFDTHMRNCIQFKWSKIVRGENGNAEIQLFIYDVPTKTIGYVPVETDIPIPEPRKQNDGPMMMAQNTPETVESIHSLGQ